ncbi:hypothetical protein EW146_g8221 [Bondarzewia mesenterica]|uniref:Uncharacterized protein n=1 Tax=Bondarzewia mesenterica TaxID=1095465 RepID=A0A4S4LHY7_9AGAM|nr:hypothetical protein EW146_g8221 [Bondarzewia mesenterica]
MLGPTVSDHLGEMLGPSPLDRLGRQKCTFGQTVLDSTRCPQTDIAFSLSASLLWQVTMHILTMYYGDATSFRTSRRGKSISMELDFPVVPRMLKIGVYLTLIDDFRFADRDMVMRYHWGFAVGHAYAHDQTASLVAPVSRAPVVETRLSDVQLEELGTGSLNDEVTVEPDNEDTGNPDSQLGYCEDDGWEDDSEVSGNERGDEISDDDMLIEMDDMYN